MKCTVKLIVFILLLGWIGKTFAADQPHIGFVYPAGGQPGTVYEALIGGQYLNGATNAFVSGEGVKVDIVRYSVKYEPRQLRQIWRRRKNREDSLEDKNNKERNRLLMQIKRDTKLISLTDVPEGMDPFDQEAVRRYYTFDKKEQFNPQIAERLSIKVTIDKTAPPGEREMRINTAAGLSNPIYFQVGSLSEVLETEPNDDHMSPELQEIPVPSIINGQVRPGDIDHFRFKAKKGDSLVLDVGARRIIPYLADAVPGWFQAVVAIYDEDGNEVAYQDDYKFNPDPVLFFDVPEPGVYTLSIRDSIYRGREDFVYRIAIGELPFITSIFPLGAQEGTDVDIALSGKNLPKKKLTGKLPSDGSSVRLISVKQKKYRSNQIPFAIGDVAELTEIEPNNVVANAQSIDWPLVINGRIQESGDRDCFSFHAKEGDTVSIGVVARRLNSPLDSVITLTGPGLEHPVRNDDYVNKDKTHLHLGAGLVTHHADSYLLHKLPATGIYFVEIGDTQYKGGHDYGYRLRVSPASPGFKLSMEPSGLHLAPGGTAVCTIHAKRMEGFSGCIDLSITNIPADFKVSQGAIAANTESTQITITAPRKSISRVVKPQVSGTALINNQTVTRIAEPVDDQMQAFLYRHLVPAQELVLAQTTERQPIWFEVVLPPSGIIELPLGKEKYIRVQAAFQQGARGHKLRLDNPPEGLSLVKGWVSRKKAKTSDGRWSLKGGPGHGGLTLKAEAPLKPGDTCNLIISALIKKKRDETLYPSPAIPIKIVEPH